MGLKKVLFFGAVAAGTTALISYKSLNQLKKIKIKNSLLDATEDTKDFFLDKVYYLNDYKEDIKDCFFDGVTNFKKDDKYKDFKDHTETFFPTENPTKASES